MPSRAARLALSTKASRMRFRPAASSASGAASPSLCGSADGATVCQPPCALRNELAAVPGPRAGGLAAGMGELHRDGRGGMLAHGGEDLLQRGLAGVAVEPETARRDAADRLHMGRLDAEHRRARQREVVDVGEVPVGGDAVVGRILAHRRHHDAVLQRQAAQLDRGKQGAHAGSSGGWRNGSDCMKFSSPTANCQLRGGHARPRRHALRASYDHKAEITLGRLPGTPLSSRGTRSAAGIHNHGIGLCEDRQRAGLRQTSLLSPWVIAARASRAPGRRSNPGRPYSSSSNLPGTGLPMRMRPSGNSSPSASAENWIVLPPPSRLLTLPSGPSLSASAVSSSTNTRYSVR